VLMNAATDTAFNATITSQMGVEGHPLSFAAACSAWKSSQVPPRQGGPTSSSLGATDQCSQTRADGEGGDERDDHVGREPSFSSESGEDNRRTSREQGTEHHRCTRL